MATVAAFFLISLAALGNFPKGSYGKGFVEIFLEKLHNPEHLDGGRECCDVWPWKKCRGQCDTQLHLCLTNFAVLSSRLSCNVAKVTTKTYSGQSSIKFEKGETLGKNLKNPLKFEFETWEKFAEVMFTSYDDDLIFGDDLIDVYSTIFPTYPAANYTAAGTGKHVQISGRVSTIKFNVKVYCDNNYEGLKCEKLKSA